MSWVVAYRFKIVIFILFFFLYWFSEYIEDQISSMFMKKIANLICLTCLYCLQFCLRITSYYVAPDILQLKAIITINSKISVTCNIAWYNWTIKISFAKFRERFLLCCLSLFYIWCKRWCKTWIKFWK